MSGGYHDELAHLMDSPPEPSELSTSQIEVFISNVSLLLGGSLDNADRARLVAYRERLRDELDELKA